ncbi:transaldolase [Candidatus Micrarchaeota archaeon RBG_16_36_9]|nr:MAG: transaldolase [Candidatus Micrarchaeota archaeon RBG_16_36_9]
MRIFLDTAKLDEIKKMSNYIDGVTTNPSLIKEAISEMNVKTRMEDYIGKICEITGNGKPVSLEVISTTEKNMVEEAKFLFDKFNNIANNVVIKIPVNTNDGKSQKSNYEGLNAIKEINNQNIPVNATLIMTPEQALLASRAGANYASPFIGRIDDYIRKNAGIVFDKADYFPSIGIKECNDKEICSGIDLIRKILVIFKNYSIKTKVIAASVRNVIQAREAATVGVHIVTIPFKVLGEMISHPKTTEGIIRFSEDTIPEYEEMFKK